MTTVLTGSPTAITARPSATVTAPVDADAFSSAIVQVGNQTLLNYIQGLIADALLLSAANVQTAVNTACVRGTGNGSGAGGAFTGGASGPGVTGNGLGAQPGGSFVGGPTGSGVYGQGGVTSGAGGTFQGGGGNSNGVTALASGNGYGGSFTSAAAAGIAVYAYNSAAGIALQATAVAGGIAIRANGAIVQTQVTLTYGASIAVDASLGNDFVVTVTNGSAYTFATPTNPQIGQRISIRVRNTFGTIIAPAFSAGFKLQSGATATVPNGYNRTWDFVYEGATTVWVMCGGGVTDVAN